MFRSRNRHVFKPTAYGTRRQRRIPRWLVLMVSGVILGAGGLLFLQKSYGPTRLTAEQSEQLQYALNSANLEKQRLQSELNQQGRLLSETTEQLDLKTQEMAAVADKLARFEHDIDLFADALPPDPRGTSPGIRAATLRNVDGNLDYRILVIQDHDKEAIFKGEVELVAAGRYSSGRTAHVPLPPFEIELQHYAHLEGVLPLPEHFTAREVTIRITAEGQDKLSATRTIIASR